MISFWTPERTAQLRELIADGVTRARAAAILGTTKNAVVSKCQREHISNEREYDGPTMNDRLAVMQFPSARHCVWPLWDNKGAPDFKFCREQVHGSRPYCREHWRVAWRRS